MEKIIKKIVGIDTETQKRAIASIVTFIINGIILFGGVNIPNEKIEYIVKAAVIIGTAIIWAIGFYYNENYSEAGCEGTGYTRLKKEQEKLIDMGEDPDFEGFEMDETYEPIKEDIEDIESE